MENTTPEFYAMPPRRGRPKKVKPLTVRPAPAPTNAPTNAPVETEKTLHSATDAAPNTFAPDPFASVASIPSPKSDDDVGAPVIEQSAHLFQGQEKAKNWDGFFFYVYNRDAITITGTGEQRVIGTFSSPLSHESFDLEFQQRAGNRMLLVRLSEKAQMSDSALLPPFEEHLQLYITKKSIDPSDPTSLSYHLERARSGQGIRPFPVITNSERDSDKVGNLDSELAQQRPLHLGRYEPSKRTMT